MKKLNNKGFSLVELIIVIAIMAILVGVVGAQVIPYLERSREGKDLQIISGWNTSATSAYSSAAAQIVGTGAYKITISDGAPSAVVGADTVAALGSDSSYPGCDKIKTFFDELNGVTGDYNFGDFESKKGKTELDRVEIVIDGTAGTFVTRSLDSSNNEIFDVVETK